jgi:hypothetical protein
MPTPYEIFYDAIPNVLGDGPKAHREIAEQLKNDFPEYCDDSILCPHTKAIRPEWDHHARTAEQNLQRNRIIRHNKATQMWELVQD